MVKHTPSSLIVSKAHYEKSPEYLSKLIRGTLYGLKITNRQFHERYLVAVSADGKATPRNSNSHISALRGDIYNNEKLMSIYIFRTIVNAIGYDIVSMWVDLEDTETSEVTRFSTETPLSDILKMAPDTGEPLLIDPSTYDNPPALLSRLIRGIVLARRITKKRFQALYKARYAKMDQADVKGAASRISAFVNDIKNPKKVISFYIFDAICRVLGYRIKAMGYTISDKVTHEMRSFSTTQSGDDIDKDSAAHSVVGIASL